MIQRALRPAWFGLVLLAAALLPTSAVTLSGQGGQTASGVVAIRNATIMTATRGTIANGTIVMRDGKIAAVGANVSIPAGAEVVDGTGKFVSPGIIDAHSHIANDAINEGQTAVSSMTGMEDVLDPTDIAIQRDLAGGLTIANIMHGSANPIGGKTVVIKLRWGADKAADLLIDGALPGIKFALGENPKRQGLSSNTGLRRYPGTRQGVDFVIRDAFTRAKAYQKAWQDYERTRTTTADALPPRRDLQLDALVEVLEGKRLVHAHSYRADEILALIRLADEMGFKIATFQHVLEGYKVAKEIAAHGAGASTFSDWWGYKIEAEDAIPGNAALMTHKGVTVSINSDSAEHARRLNTEAAKSVRWGDLNDDQAFALVTINPATQLGIADRVGSLEVGKDADVVIWNQNPLSTYAIVERTYIDGKLYYDREAELARVAQVEQEKAALQARLGDGRGQGGARGRGAAAPTMPAPSDGPGNLFSIAPAPIELQYNANGPAWAITNARIVTGAGPAIERGTVVIRGNRIQAVGANVSVPSGARTVDARGANVYPGFIDAASDLGLNEPGVRGMDDVSEMLEFNQMLRTRVAYQSDSDAIPVARVEGVTNVGVFMGGGVITGDVPLMNLDGWTWEENAVRPAAGLGMSWPGGGGGGRGGRGGGGGGGANVQDQVRRLNELLSRTKAYMADANRQMNWDLEPFIPVLQKAQPFYVQAGNADAIRDAIGWAEAQGVNVVIRTSGMAALEQADLLARKNVPVILSEIFSMPQGEDTFHAATYQAPGKLAAAGVTFAFSSGGYDGVRLVPFQAAMAVAWGLDRERAVRALTIDAARIFGADRALGTIEAGKLANLIVVTGDPLEIRSRIQHVVIAGNDVPLDSKHTDLFRRYMSRQ
ncbi:MAG TPA: amidohydrolase family protein [Vicinamibacterales bacterium]|nr:amidohydrolase family protein [Vicinamibacterales bacterium]